MSVIVSFVRNRAILPVNAPKRQGGPVLDILRALGQHVHTLLVIRENPIPRAVHSIAARVDFRVGGPLAHSAEAGLPRNFIILQDEVVVQEVLTLLANLDTDLAGKVGNLAGIEVN